MSVFNNKVTKEAPKINLIGLGSSITGNFTCNGDVRIDGTVTGDVVCNGKMILGSAAKIEGSLTAINAEIFGEIKGNIKTSEILYLKNNAVVKGNIQTAKLSIEPGAIFTGQCTMGGLVKDIINVAKNNEINIIQKEQIA